MHRGLGGGCARPLRGLNCRQSNENIHILIAKRLMTQVSCKRSEARALMSGDKIISMCRVRNAFEFLPCFITSSATTGGRHQRCPQAD